VKGDVRCDVAVVGSGAGGSVVAYHLAKGGERVVVLERGADVRPEDMSADELEMIATLYKDGGAQMNTASDMFLLQGSCVGGSTVLTNAVCFRMPEGVRRSLAARGFDLPADRLAESFERIEDVLNVHPLEERLWNAAAWRMVDGMRALGLEPGRFQKAMLGCVACGACNVGCRYGRKLDASLTWIPMARRHGAEVLDRVEVVRLLVERGGVTGLLCRDLRDGRAFRVRADRVVLAGGAINTPELLLRSGVLRDRVGRRTSFNAGAILFAEYDEPLDGFDGDQMCVHHFGDGWILEQVQNPPMSFAMTMAAPMANHHEDLEGYRRFASAGVLVPTAAVGRVYLGRGHRLVRSLFDHADVRFRMPDADVATFRRGAEQLVRIFFASGARRVIAPTRARTELRSVADLPRLERALRRHEDLAGLGSSHPHGGATLGDDDRRDVVDPTFRVRGLGNCFVADASLFPESLRVNPMLSIMAVAEQAVAHVAGRRPEGPVEEGPAFEARRRRARIPSPGGVACPS
jgi:choline dehydrogenase-like flavoprotein